MRRRLLTAVPVTCVCARQGMAAAVAERAVVRHGLATVRRASPKELWALASPSASL